MAAATLAQTVARPALSRRQLELAVTCVVMAGWTGVVLGGRTGVVAGFARPADLLIYSVPGLAGLVVLLWRPHSPAWARLALGWSLTVLAAIIGLEEVGSDYLYALAPVVLASSTAAALRWPLHFLLGAFLLSGAYNSIGAFTPIDTGPLMDLVLAGAWLALVYSYVRGRARPAVIGPPLFLIGLYLAVTFAGALVAEDLQRSMYALRSSAWLMTLVFLVGLWADDEDKRLWMHRGALVVGAIVGGYAMLRWAIGPAGKEAAGARDGALYVSNDLGELRLIGSLPSPQGLAVWCCALLPFGLASALAPIGTRWRLLAALVTGMAGAAIFGADVRFAMVAALAGAVTVLAIFACARGFSGRRAMPLAVIAVLVAVGASAFVTTKLSAEGSSGERFKSLVTDPLNDYSVQDRFVKWRALLAEVDDKPFGLGLGASGAAEKKYARFVTTATFDPDSSYVKIAYDQGFLVLILFAAAMITLLASLAVQAVGIADPRAAARALAGCGALAAFAVAMTGATYIEGLESAGAWSLVAIGCTVFITHREPTGG